MGKAHKVKGELVDAVEMVDLVQTLKDIADNRLHTLTSMKDKFRRFGETFIEFFRLISLTSVEHPLISNKHPEVGILVVTIDGSFLGEFNNKIIRRALNEKDEFEKYRFIALGQKSVDRLRPFTPDLKTFPPVSEMGMYEMAIEVKDFLVEELMNNKLTGIVFPRIDILHLKSIILGFNNLPLPGQTNLACESLHNLTFSGAITLLK